MARPCSMDLRERVVAAVVGEGMSCHAAAARFGVAASSAIKWVQRVRATGSAAPSRMGGRRTRILSGKVPYGHWRTMTFLAALRCDRIDAPCVLDQPVNGQSFTDYIEQCLVPTLSPGDVVIMDNLSSHKRPAVRQAIRSAWARLLFLPPYSPDLNPIEQVFAKLKHLLRKAAERSHEAAWRPIGTLLDAFPPAECRNYLINAGYGST